MVSEEVLENTDKTAQILYVPEAKLKTKKKRKIKKIFSNEDVILTLLSLGVSTIIIILMIVAGALGAKFPTGLYWF